MESLGRNTKRRCVTDPDADGDRPVVYPGVWHGDGNTYWRQLLVWVRCDRRGEPTNPEWAVLTEHPAQHTGYHVVEDDVDSVPAWQRDEDPTQ